MRVGDFRAKTFGSGSWTPGPLIPSAEESNSRQIEEFDKRSVTETVTIGSLTHHHKAKFLVTGC